MVKFNRDTEEEQKVLLSIHGQSSSSQNKVPEGSVNVEHPNAEFQHDIRSFPPLSNSIPPNSNLSSQQPTYRSVALKHLKRSNKEPQHIPFSSSVEDDNLPLSDTQPSNASPLDGTDDFQHDLNVNQPTPSSQTQNGSPPCLESPSSQNNLEMFYFRGSVNYSTNSANVSFSASSNTRPSSDNAQSESRNIQGNVPIVPPDGVHSAYVTFYILPSTSDPDEGRNEVPKGNVNVEHPNAEFQPDIRSFPPLSNSIPPNSNLSSQQPTYRSVALKHLKGSNKEPEDIPFSSSVEEDSLPLSDTQPSNASPLDGADDLQQKLSLNVDQPTSSSQTQNESLPCLEPPSSQNNLEIFYFWGSVNYSTNSANVSFSASSNTRPSSDNAQSESYDIWGHLWILSFDGVNGSANMEFYRVPSASVPNERVNSNDREASEAIAKEDFPPELISMVDNLFK